MEESAYRSDPALPDLGAAWDGQGVRFALFSEHATSATLCLVDQGGRETRIEAARRSGHIWHAYVRGAGPGQRYGWRVDGPYAPLDGHRFNAGKLLVDPYARAVDGLLSVVADDRFDWGDDRPPRTPWSETVIYETHVKGFTKKHPRVPEAQRGTFLGFASDAAIAHLTGLGVTAVELLPIHAHLDEPALTARGLTNYWGYNTLAYFAADERFAARGGEGALRELKQMVKRLHAAGIDVLLDVVYNHTCEGDRLGPTVSLRGIDNRVYYRLNSADLSDYVDDTGCGNTLDCSHPQALKLVMDSLRYWVTEVHIDGFRFDLAPALARNEGNRFDARSAFLATLHQDPVLSRVKWIAEPWDLGEQGLALGDFPAPWSEWNSRFRDTVRRFWRGERKVIADLGYRLTGSSDLFSASERTPYASVNYIASHDGFTLRDLASYERRHNEGHGEPHEDGHGDELSQSCGVEGDTSDERVLAKRRTLTRSLLTTVLLSRGTPMFQMGDEMWRTQEGHSNAYCHDSELTWVDWSGEATDGDARAMRDFAASLTLLRKRHASLRGGEFLSGTAEGGSPRKDITWLRQDGVEMAATDWASPVRATIAFCLAGVATHDAALLVLMNGERHKATFALPAGALAAEWTVAVDTCERPRAGATAKASEAFDLDAGGLVVMVEVSRGSP